MTSKERIRAALNFDKTDRIPIDIGGMGSSGISAIACKKLRDYLKLDGLVKVYDVYQQLGWVEDDLRDYLGGDVNQILKLRGAFDIKRNNWKEGTMADGTPCLVPFEYTPVIDEKGDYIIKIDDKVLGRRSVNGLYYDYDFLPYGNVESESDIDKVPLDIYSEEDLDFIEKKVIDRYYNSDKAILLDFGGDVLGGGQNTWGYEKFFMSLALEKDLVHYFLNRLTDAYIINLKNILDRVSKYIDVVNFCDDLGTQIAPQISVSMYREILKPYHRRQFEFVRNNYRSVKVFLHSCGSIEPLIPDLIDAGVQILNPVQIAAKGMDPKHLKKEYGKDIVFWGGGADMQSFVPMATIEQIKSHVNELVDIFSKDSGFVFTQVHNIQANVEPEKILAIYQTARNYKV